MDRTKVSSQQPMESDKVISQHPMGSALFGYCMFTQGYIDIKFCMITPVHYNVVGFCTVSNIIIIMRSVRKVQEYEKQRNYFEI